MIKILVFSDSHGQTLEMHKIIKSYAWDMVLHLGDCFDDFLEIKDCYDIPMYGVIGNVDFNNGLTLQTIEVEGVKITLCHGHIFRVKTTKEHIRHYTETHESQVMLFGHTHEPIVEEKNVLFMNPGSIRFPRGGRPKSYGVLTLENKKVKGEIFYLK
jgi:hypothetical protein